MGLKDLLLIMKFVYNYATLDDVEQLYNHVKAADLKIPMKSLEDVKSTIVIEQPLAISNHFEGLNQFDIIPQSFYNRFWTNETLPYFGDGWVGMKHMVTWTDFRPSMTDYGLCSTFNAELEKDVFQDVNEFHDVFLGSLKSENINLESAALREYTFIIDTQKRTLYPFKVYESTNLARYVFWKQFKILKFSSLIS